MKRVLLAMVAILVIPGVVMATATLGVYISGKLFYTPSPGIHFDAYLYIVQDEYEVTGVQYSLSTPDDPGHGQMGITGIEYPWQKTISLGDPWNGHAITYSPPVECVPYGYAWLVKYDMVAYVPCEDMWDYHIVVVGHPDPGLEHPVYGSLYGTYAPDHYGFPIDGLTTVICPFMTDVEEESWGAIKSMYR